MGPVARFSHSAGGVVLDDRGFVLVVQQRDLSWSLPKGSIRQGEDPRDAAVREIVEESGLIDLRLVRILKSYTRFAMRNTGSEDTSKVKRITMYLFRTSDQTLSPLDPRIPEARWVPKEEVAAFLTHPKDQEFFLGILPELEDRKFVGGKK